MLLKEGARADIIDNVSIVIHNLLTTSNEYCLMNTAEFGPARMQEYHMAIILIFFIVNFCL